MIFKYVLKVAGQLVYVTFEKGAPVLVSDYRWADFWDSYDAAELVGKALEVEWAFPKLFVVEVVIDAAPEPAMAEVEW